MAAPKFVTNPFGAYYDESGNMVQDYSNSAPVVEEKPAAPVVEAPVAPVVVGKPAALGAFKYDPASGLSLEDAKAQYALQKAQYDEELKNYYSTGTDKEAIDWRTNDYRTKYKYLTGDDGSALDGNVFTNLADGTTSAENFAAYRTDWATKRLANKNWSGFDEAGKAKYIQDVADGKIAAPDLPKPPEPEPPPPEVDPSTLGYNPATGLLNSANIGVTNADGSMNVTADKLTEADKKAMIDGLPTTLAVGKDGKLATGSWISNPDGSKTFVSTGGLRLRTISKAEFEKSKITAQTADNVETRFADKADVEKVNAGLIGKHYDAATGEYIDVVPDKVSLVTTDKDGNITGGALSKLSDYKKDVPQYVVGDKLNDSIDALNAKTSAATIDISPESLTSNRLSGLLSKNNPYIQQARNAATLQASRRGMLDTSAAAGMAQDAAIKAAYQIANADANIYANAQTANALAQNTLINKKYDTSATALDKDLTRNQVVSDANVKSEIDYNADDKKNLVAGLGTQFAADARREEVQYQGDNGVFQFNAGAQNNANNAYTDSINKAYQSTADNAVKTALFNVDQVNGFAKVNANNYLAWLDKKYDTLNDAEKKEYDNVNDFLKTNTLIQAELQKQINGQVFNEINYKNSDSNTLNRLLVSGNIELAQIAAKNVFDKAMASDKFERDVMLAKLAQTYDLEKIQVTNDFDWNKFQIEVLAKKEIAQADREAQVISSFADGLIKEIGAIDRMPDITGEAKTEAKNQYIAMGAGFINLLSDSGTLGLAELLMPEFPTAKEAVDKKKSTTSTAPGMVNF